MTSPPLQLEEISNLAAVISAKVDQDFGSVRAFINAVRAECGLRGIDVGYRYTSRVYLRWQKENATEIDIREGLEEGRRGQDRTFGSDPTGEEAVRNVMRQLITRNDPQRGNR